MRVNLKGINQITKRLADGSSVTYYYAWKSGPRLPGKPGDPEFIATFNEAVAKKVQEPKGTLQSLLNAYQTSPNITDLAPPSLACVPSGCLDGTAARRPFASDLDRL